MAPKSRRRSGSLLSSLVTRLAASLSVNLVTTLHHHTVPLNSKNALPRQRKRRRGRINDGGAHVPRLETERHEGVDHERLRIGGDRRLRDDRQIPETQGHLGIHRSEADSGTVTRQKGGQTRHPRLVNVQPHL